jgi:hypothetical protein
MQLRNASDFWVPRDCAILKATAGADLRMGEGGLAPGAVEYLGTSEEDDPVTWETLVSSRRLRRVGEPVTNPRARRAPADGAGAVAEPSGRRLREERAIRPWQVEARGTGAETDGDEGVGGPNTSDEAG